MNHLRELWTSFLTYLLIWAALRLGYSFTIWTGGSNSDEGLHVLHLFDTEANLHLSISQYMREAQSRS